MPAFIAAYWPVIVAGFSFGIVAGILALRFRHPSKKEPPRP